MPGKGPGTRQKRPNKECRWILLWKTSSGHVKACVAQLFDLPDKGNDILNQDIETLLYKIRLRTENLFMTRQLMCSEAVLTVLNQGLKGELSPEIAVRITSGLPE